MREPLPREYQGMCLLSFDTVHPQFLPVFRRRIHLLPSAHTSSTRRSRQTEADLPRAAGFHRSTQYSPGFYLYCSNNRNQHARISMPGLDAVLDRLTERHLRAFQRLPTRFLSHSLFQVQHILRVRSRAAQPRWDSERELYVTSGDSLRVAQANCRTQREKLSTSTLRRKSTALDPDTVSTKTTPIGRTRTNSSTSIPEHLRHTRSIPASLKTLFTGHSRANTETSTLGHKTSTLGAPSTVGQRSGSRRSSLEAESPDSAATLTQETTEGAGAAVQGKGKEAGAKDPSRLPGEPKAAAAEAPKAPEGQKP